jgi:hypothetical protein
VGGAAGVECVVRIAELSLEKDDVDSRVMIGWEELGWRLGVVVSRHDTGCYDWT